MYFYSTCNRLSRLRVRELEIVKKSRRKIHLSDFVISSKKHSLKGKSDSSTRWLKRQAKDAYVHQAVKDGYRCRSAYKLLEIDEKFHFLRPGTKVVDCGASPGSWMQVALQKTKCNENSGIVIGVDLLDIKDIPGSITLSSCDFTHSDVQQRIKQFLPHGHADVVISDMAPLSTGNKKLDHSKIIDLNRSALEFAKTVLSDGGCFLCKLWDGSETEEFIEEISESFSFCKQVKPKASRLNSSELYIFSTGFRKKEIL